MAPSFIGCSLHLCCGLVAILIMSAWRLGLSIHFDLVYRRDSHQFCRQPCTACKFISLLLTFLAQIYHRLPATSPAPTKASSPSVSTLPNGLTVVTEDAASSTTVSMVYPKAGSVNEMPSEQGAALVNKCLAFNSGSGISTMMIMRNIEDDGGVPFAAAGKYGACLGFTCPPENAARLAPLLATDCSFEKWDVRDAKKLAAVEVEVANESAQVVLTEHIYAGAFGAQSVAGRPYYYTSPGSVSLDSIKSFRSRAYGMNGAVLAATGVADHAAFVKQLEEGLAASPAGSSEAAPTPVYVGGESRLAVTGSSYTHVALAFDGTSASTPLLNVIKHVFNISGSEVGASAFATKDLVGVYGGGVGGTIADSLCDVVTKAGPELVKRAKVLAKAEALFALDGGSKALADAMTASVVETGSFAGAAGVAAAYDAITEKEVEAAVVAMYKKTPTLAAVGDISNVPYLGSIASRFS